MRCTNHRMTQIINRILVLVFFDTVLPSFFTSKRQLIKRGLLVRITYTFFTEVCQCAVCGPCSNRGKTKEFRLEGSKLAFQQAHDRGLWLKAT